jgi:uncharacterized protein VirK/YbjX
MTSLIMSAGRKTSANGLFLRHLLVLARQKEAWSLSRVVRVFRAAFSNIGTQSKIFQLLKLPPFAEAASNHPRFRFKYLEHGYLVIGFTLLERPSCFLHHYRRLYTSLPDSLLCQLLQGNITLHEMLEDGQRFSITMGLSTPCDNEGEMSLNLQVGEKTVFILSFTIVPGWVIKSKAKEILLVTRIQGMKGCYNQIQLATRTLHDIAPSHLLLAALQGIAGAFGIGEMAGVCAARQKGGYTEERANSIEKAYDAFFTDLGLAPNAAGFFLGPIPLQEKPLSFIKPGHKLRTKEKRAFKLQVQRICASFLDEVAQVPSNELAPHRSDWLPVTSR